jgi:glutaminase
MEVARREIPRGAVADYIPELGKVDPDQLGICVYPLRGEKILLGEAEKRFTMQSISKILSLCVALEIFGAEKLFEKVGAEPSGEAFNSLVELDLNSNKPYNPLINSGAIAVAGMLIEEVSFHDMLRFARELCDDESIELNKAVFESEMGTCSRNRAIGYLLESKSIIETDVEDALRFYTRMCSLDVTAESLANFANRLANDGVGNLTGKRYLSSETVRIVKTLMLTCGMYDGSGTYAVEVGIPTKSGVGGGLLRDVMAGDTPYIFVKHVYASASLVGALLCGILWNITGELLAMLIGMSVVVIIRILSAHYRWNLPKAKD